MNPARAADRDRSRSPRTNHAVRPAIECLEDRCTPATFFNNSGITILDDAPADIYPSTIQVSGLLGTVSKVTVTLQDFNHTRTEDVDILLVGPDGTNAIILSDVGGPAPVTFVFVVLDDAAATALPGRFGGPLVSGTFRPHNENPPNLPPIPGFESDTFPAPAPVPSGGSVLSNFKGSNPNGTWRLFVLDDLPGNFGVIDGGWSLTIETAIGRATDVTPTTIVTAGKLQMRGKRARQSVTITNNHSVPYAGLVSLVFSGLKRKVKVLGQSGRTAVVSPGSPFVSLALGGDGDLDPGESVTFNLVFKNPTGGRFRFTPLVVAGLGTL